MVGACLEGGCARPSWPNAVDEVREVDGDDDTEDLRAREGTVQIGERGTTSKSTEEVGHIDLR